MNEPATELPTASLLITDLGDHTYRLIFGNKRRRVAVIATGSQLDRWTAAALGVVSTVVLTTRERVHDIGVFKAVGMTPRQSVTMVACWVAGIGLVAGVIAVAAGIALHHELIPRMASFAGNGMPPRFLDVYSTAEVAALALTGLVIAVAGALLPAGWAAGIPAASALRAE